MDYSKKAFTLVELIVVVGIISILSSIGAVAYLNYASSLRDTSRLTQMTEMYNGLTAYSINNRIPLQSNQIEIISNGKVIGYQGNIDSHLLETINYTGIGKDPKTLEPFTIMMNKMRNKFQILGYLENTQNNGELYASIGEKSYANYGYEHPYSSGNKLGIIMDSDNIVIHKEQEIIDQGSFDVQTENKQVVIQYGGEKIYEGNMLDLDFYSATLTSGGVEYSSCKEIYDNLSAKERKNGDYLIILGNNQDVLVECNMTDNGGGWTRYAEIIDEYSFSLAEECYNSYGVVETQGFYCFNPHRQMVDAKNLMVQINQDYASATSGDQYVMDVLSKIVGISPVINSGSTRSCSPENKYMTPMDRGGSYYDGVIDYYRLGLSFCGNSRQPGGVNRTNIMNFSNSGKGPTGGNGITKARDTTVVPFTFYFR